MNNLEKKLDALMRFAASDNDFERKQIQTEIRLLFCESDPAVIYSEREREVRKVLLELCAPEHMAGYPYLVDSIILAIENEVYLDNLTWGIYAPVAVKYESSLPKVQRGMSNIIDAIWETAPIERLEAYFRSNWTSGKDRPSCGQFIARVANIVKYDLLKGADGKCR